MSAHGDIEERLSLLGRSFGGLTGLVEEHFIGQREVVEQLGLCVLAGGHALLEGAPGLGKTTLVFTLAQALGMDYRRIQFTPDLMPPDITGTRILEEEPGGARRFSFERGPVFANIVLADEINRATPRTQSALLEAMQERQVTVFGQTIALDEPFFVIATQNPIEMEGTYPLPEAQLDRFTLKIDIPHPSHEGLTAILAATTARAPLEARSLLGSEELLQMQALVRDLPVASEVIEFAARLVALSHPHHPQAPDGIRRLVRHGVSPRGGQALLMTGKARAAVAGRLHVTVADLEALAPPALRHRILLGYEGEASGVSPDDLVAEVVAAAARG
ncbi:MAG: MoxR family ATPase [Planctomycetota bacterium]|nr:MoxR family ATPase [Planctomycetota bacterium]MDP6762743.1 MoxR family ATPase [Planctomycetota bacterium]MDP6988531.1 MoxR family ATPase [Planctomycetota bacterium]